MPEFGTKNFNQPAIDRQDPRSDSDRKDFERRKSRMLELAEDRKCLPAMKVMLMFADAQSGFSDEQALIDGKLIKTYSAEGSDWLHSFKILSAAINPPTGVPSLLTVTRQESDEGRVFLQWCQEQCLNATTLIAIMDTIRKEGIAFTELQNIPYKQLSRIILETHLDRLMIHSEKMGKSTYQKKYFPLPPTGFSQPPAYSINVSPHSEADNYFMQMYIAVATFIEEQRVPPPRPQLPIQGPIPPTIIRFAHGIHGASVDDLASLCPNLFTQFEWTRDDGFFGKPHIDQNTGKWVRGVSVQVRGWNIANISDERYQTIEAEKNKQQIDEELVKYIMDHLNEVDFHADNRRFLSTDGVQKMYARSGGRIRQEQLRRFNLHDWYLEKLHTFGAVQNVKELQEHYKKHLTLTLADVVGKPLANSLLKYYPEHIAGEGYAFDVQYTFDSETKKHGATMTLYITDAQQAEALVTRLPSAMPVIGEPGQPQVNLKVIVVPEQVREWERESEEERKWGKEADPNPYPTTSFVDVPSALNYLEEARIAYALKQPSQRCTFTSAEKAEFDPQIYAEIPFVIGKPFPDSKNVMVNSEPVNPIVTTRDGEKIMPFPAIIFKESPYPEYPSTFGLVFLTTEKEAKVVEEKARKVWEEREKTHHMLFERIRQIREKK